MAHEYTREELLAICARASVPEEKWLDRDSAEAQRQLGECYALLKAGCEFGIRNDDLLKTDNKTIWVHIFSKGFSYFDWGGDRDEETYYLPTQDRLKATAGRDWY